MPLNGVSFLFQVVHREFAELAWDLDIFFAVCHEDRKGL